MYKPKDCIELQLVKEIIHIVCNSSSKGLKRRISAAGHFNRSIFTPEKYINIRLRTFYRIVINLCMDLGDKESFMKMWTEIGTTVYTIADEHGQELNDAHKRPSKTKKAK
jgi:hypothetical protein